MTIAAKTQRPEVRRFEMGASAIGNDNFLKDRGWSVMMSGPRSYRIRRTGAKGRPKNITQKQLVEMLDELRVAEGKQPVKLRACP